MCETNNDDFQQRLRETLQTRELAIKNDFRLIGKYNLFCCVDLTCLDYQKMWVVNCIRGVMDFDVKITTLNQNMDSNYVKGAFPDNFMIFRIKNDLFFLSFILFFNFCSCFIFL